MHIKDPDCSIIGNIVVLVDKIIIGQLNTLDDGVKILLRGLQPV